MAFEEEAAAILKELLRTADDAALKVQRAPEDHGVDIIAEDDGRQFAVQVKLTSDAGAVRQALKHLEHYCAAHPRAIPVLATRFMGPVGRQLCAEQGVSWFDLSGNADMKAPGLRILIEGKPNKFKRPGRPSSVFAPKASRIARWLLMYGDTGWTQHEITESTHLDKGYVSRVLKRLRGQALLRLQGEQYVADDRDLLLKAWQSYYDFSKHRIIKGVMPVRTGEEATLKIASVLGAEDYAATGLSGAWFLDKFASFRTASVYLREEPNKALFEELAFMPVEKGANVWLVRPNDDGVFQGMGQSEEGVSLAHWVQVYLDLGAHPERAREAAEHLRQTHQNWGSRGE